MNFESIPVRLTTASWTAASRQISQTGLFANYTHTPEDQIFLEEATITDGLFEVARKINDNTIELSESIKATDIGSGVTSRASEDVIISERVAPNSFRRLPTTTRRPISLLHPLP